MTTHSQHGSQAQAQDTDLDERVLRSPEHQPDAQITRGKSAPEAILADVVASTIIPKLLSQSKRLADRLGTQALHPQEADIMKLSSLILGPDHSDALEFIDDLRNKGISLDALYLELLEPTARHLGDLWDADRLDFVSVTIGIAHLQRILHHFADLERIQPYDEKRRALMMVAPGEDHDFGSQIVQKFLRAAGWNVATLEGSEGSKIIELVSREWFAVVGFSISGQMHIDALKDTIKSIKRHSLNPHIGVIIGGPMVVSQPDLVEKVGADGTAANAVTAVILAKKILTQTIAAGIADHG